MTIRAAAPSRLTFVCFASAALSVLTTFQVTAQNWPQWRGPSSAGVSSESGLPTKWSAERECRLEDPARRARHVLSDRVGRPVFVTSQIGDDSCRRRALIRSSPVTTVRSPSARTLSAAGGRIRSSRERQEQRLARRRSVPPSDGDAAVGIPRPRRRARSPSSTRSTTSRRRRRSPTANASTRGSATGSSSRSTCEGRVVWTRHLGVGVLAVQDPLGTRQLARRSTAISSSCCATIRPDSYLLALDTRTGKERWKVDRGAGASRTARRSSSPARRATSCSSTPRSASTSTTRRPGSSCGTPAVRGRRRFRRPSFTTAEST